MLWVALAACLVLISCKKESAKEELSTSPPAITQTTPDQLRTDFAKLLAKAVADASVRALIKSEAQKQFDNDYDVLFQLVKDRELRTGVTFGQYLSSLAGAETAITSLEETLPLLTIFVPELEHFSAGNWNTQRDIPLVAVVNSDFNEKERTPIKAFDHLGGQYELLSNKVPDRPVIVIKENERMIPRPKHDANAKAASHNLVFESNTNDYYLMDDQFNPAKTDNGQPASKFVINNLEGMGTLPARAHYAGAVSQRDYIYYNILNPGDQGPLNNAIEEHIVGIVFNPSADDHLDDDPTSDWADGKFEFQLDVLLFNGSSALNKITKILSVTTDSRYFTNSESIYYKFHPSIPIVTWDMKKYGDSWKYVLTEIDPGTVVNVNFTASTKIGTNYSYNSTTGTENKVSIGFGSTTEQSVTSNITTQITTGSDLCGEAVANFMSPIALEFVVIRGSPAQMYWHFADLNTGIIRLLVYPKTIGT